MEERFKKTIQTNKGSFLTFKQEEVVLSNGKKALRDTVYHPGAVCVLAVDNEEILLVRQYRYPVGEVLYEVPAGKLELNEDPLYTAQRELGEETGFEAKKWTKLSRFYTVPGFCDEIMHLYLAEELTETSTAQPDPDENITTEKIPFEKAYQMVLSGEIKDAKTIIAILLYQKNK